MIWVGTFPDRWIRLRVEIRSIHNWLGKHAIMRSPWDLRLPRALWAARIAAYTHAARNMPTMGMTQIK
jgi:hypothetical protein